MRRMDKVFADKGIIFEADERDMMRGPEYDCCRQVVDIVGDVIVTIYYSAVLDPTFYLFDRRTLELIGEQLLRPERQFFGGKNTNPWGSYTNYDPVDDYGYELNMPCDSYGPAACNSSCPYYYTTCFK